LAGGLRAKDLAVAKPEGALQEEVGLMGDGALAVQEIFRTPAESAYAVHRIVAFGQASQQLEFGSAFQASADPSFLQTQVQGSRRELK
jgi:hypothetical protein